VRGRITQRPLGLKHNDCYDDVRLLPDTERESDTLARIVESRQLRAQLQPNGLPSPWPGALHTELRRSRSATSRGRCDAGRVLSDHRVLIARSSILGGALVESRRTASHNWFVRPRDRHHHAGGDGLSDSSTRCALRSRYCIGNTQTSSSLVSRLDTNNQTSDLSLGETTRLT
jgi:hypothetical protein